MPNPPPEDPTVRGQLTGDALARLETQVAGLRRQTDNQDQMLARLGETVSRHDARLDVLEHEMARVHQQLSEVLGELRTGRENGQVRWEKVLTFMDELRGRQAQQADEREQARDHIAGKQVQLARRSLYIAAAAVVVANLVTIILHFVH